MDTQELRRARWRKSSYSGQNGSCVEVAAWAKSTYSGQSGSCVEVASTLPNVVAVRDSKNPEGPRLSFAPDQWRRFATQIKAGTFDTA